MVEFDTIAVDGRLRCGMHHLALVFDRACAFTFTARSSAWGRCLFPPLSPGSSLSRSTAVLGSGARPEFARAVE
jgi:hypothetical protein